MSLINFISNQYPSGLPYFKTSGYFVNDTIVKKNKCIFCYDFEKREDYVKFCPTLYITKNTKLSEEQEEVFRYCVSHILPLELQDMIIDFTNVNKKHFIPLQLDEFGIKHFMKCTHCNMDFMNLIEKESCPDHVLPRYYNKILGNDDY
jgi:hypothetical protein